MVKFGFSRPVQLMDLMGWNILRGDLLEFFFKESFKLLTNNM